MSHNNFDLHHTLHKLAHYLPAQAPLKDFIHHNTLHAFQEKPFFEALAEAQAIFGYKTLLSLAEYRKRYALGEVRPAILDRVLTERKGADAPHWKSMLLQGTFASPAQPRIGALRSLWKKAYRVDPVSVVDPLLFRMLCSYLDQGISIWNFPVVREGFAASLRHLERSAFTSFFKTKKAAALLQKETTTVEGLLKMLIGDREDLFERYLFDQQFAHQGWSGMVCAIEAQPETLLDRRPVSLHDLVLVELLLEIDLLQSMFGDHWKPLSEHVEEAPENLFAAVPSTDLDTVLALWQEALEWSHHERVAASVALPTALHEEADASKIPFQALFCIDDRECSIRRHIEAISPQCQTFGTPGFFGVEFYFQPQGGKFLTKLCPAPVTPKFLIKEVAPTTAHKSNLHLTSHSHSLFKGWLISQTLGYASAVKLFLNVFRPTMSPATASSFRHMHQQGELTLEHVPGTMQEQGLQVGFTVDEMAQRAEGQLRSIGLVRDFAPLVYLIGHGSSSTNNPHFAAYDCGACSGRPGSVNARVMSAMLNHPDVRKILAAKGIEIGEGTRFVGGLHDTTRDEIEFFDVEKLPAPLQHLHKANNRIFLQALEANAHERSRRLELVDTQRSRKWVHERVKLRSVSLFEPRPELNHATNACCIVGRRALTRHLFLDRRAFLNSYDYREDPEGNYLLGVLRPIAPVCGGINLEYFFSRVDNEKLGAGSKLPHNVMGLIGVANGIDGDLRPGLPSQMIEVHDPVRLLVVVEHHPEVVMRTLRKSPETLDWFVKGWIHLVVLDPEQRSLWRLEGTELVAFRALDEPVPIVPSLTSLIESTLGNLPILQMP
jgi:uncharacterized protein YbcC (UPF0753/DUF2309 family)